MIPRITRGSSARSALAYDFGPGRREEHENPRTVEGNVPGGWREQADTIDETVAAKPRVSKGIHRTSLRAAPEDRTLSDEEWGLIAQRYVQEMGVEDHPWTATRHGDDHIHLTVSRVSWEGQVKPLSHDYAKAQAACRGIEREHDLVDASQRYDRSRPQVSHGERERSERLGRPSEREQLRGHIDASAAAAARGGSVGENPRASQARFEEALAERGVIFRCNRASTGRVSGYSYGLAAHRDARGEQVFYKGSDLGKDYRWATTAQRLQSKEPRSLTPQQRARQDLAGVQGAQVIRDGRTGADLMGTERNQADPETDLARLRARGDLAALRDRTGAARERTWEEAVTGGAPELVIEPPVRFGTADYGREMNRRDRVTRLARYTQAQLDAMSPQERQEAERRAEGPSSRQAYWSQREREEQERGR